MARLLAPDKQTNVGSSLDHIRCKTGLDPWLFGGDVWRVEYASKLLFQRVQMFYEGYEDNGELDKIIHSLVTN